MTPCKVDFNLLSNFFKLANSAKYWEVPPECVGRPVMWNMTYSYFSFGCVEETWNIIITSEADIWNSLTYVSQTIRDITLT